MMVKKAARMMSSKPPCAPTRNIDRIWIGESGRRNLDIDGATRPKTPARVRFPESWSRKACLSVRDGVDNRQSLRSCSRYHVRRFSVRIDAEWVLSLLFPAPEISNLSIRSRVSAVFDKNMWRKSDDHMDSAAWEDASPEPDAAIRPRMTTSAGRYALQAEVRLAVW